MMVSDLEITIEPRPGSGSGQWRIEARSTEPTTRIFVDALSDLDLATVQDLPAEGRTWAGFLSLLSPNNSFRPSSYILRAVGKLIMKRLFSATVDAHIRKMEAAATSAGRKLRILLTIHEDEDPILARIPLELAHDGERFFFKRLAIPSFRCLPETESRDIHLGPGSHVLVVTAHSDTEKHPDQDSLKVHAGAVMVAVRNAGFTAEHLVDATKLALHARIIAEPRIDVLYIACHGIEDRKQMGQLILRDEALSGEDVATWLEEATALDRQVQLVVLCACSSAAPQHHADTSGMAQWLVRPKRAVAALGFRAAVDVGWALRWSERFFGHLGAGVLVEEAFTFARCQEPDNEPQWPLPLLYSRRCELQPILQSRVADCQPRFRSLLPSPSRTYFTGRHQQIAILRRCVEGSGTSQVTVIEGRGGVGKSELARKIAHEQHAKGHLVIWLERSDRDLSATLAALIAICRPDFRPPSPTDEEALLAMMRADLGRSNGLLVLDDIADSAVVAKLLPGSRWHVLITTRVQSFIPEARCITLFPLTKKSSLRLLAQIIWGANEPPIKERAAAARLVEQLDGYPLALEVAAGTLRSFATIDEYLVTLDLHGVLAEAKVGRTIERSLSELDAADARVFVALGVLPAAGATERMVATTVEQPRPPVARALDRLVRCNLAEYSPTTGRYVLHPLTRKAARSKLGADDELYRGAANAMENLAKWVHALVGVEGNRARERWNSVRDIFDSLDPDPWLSGAPGGDVVATALTYVYNFRLTQTYDELQAGIAAAEQLSRGGEGFRRAYVLYTRGELRRGHGDLSGAAEDYGAALSLFAEIRHMHGMGTVLSSRGQLRHLCDDYGGAANDYEWALRYLAKVGEPLGIANALKDRGRLRHACKDFRRARKDFDRAVSVYGSIGEQRGQASTLLLRGDLRRNCGHLRLAAEDYDIALNLYKTLGDQVGEADVYQSLGELAFTTRDYSQARSWYEAAAPIYQNHKNIRGLGNAFAELGKVCDLLGDETDAQMYARDAITIASCDNNSYAMEVARSVLGQTDAEY